MDASNPAEHLLSKNQLARQLDVDPRTLSKILDSGRLSPDFVRGRELLFYPARVIQLRGTLGK